MTDVDDDFLARWSRRKRDAREGLPKTSALEPVPPEPAKAAVPETPATAPPAPATGKPRWGAIFVLLIVLSTWLAMFGFVVAGMLERSDDGVRVSSMIWVALSIYGTIVLMRKLGHMYRGGSWLQTPADAARKSGGDTA